MSNTFGTLFKVTTFGESHGVGLGVVIDGMPSNIEFNLNDLQKFVDRRRPGRLKVSTPRNEPDQCEIISGIFENKTLGTPITVLVRNTNQKSKDYEKLKSEYRPGHADKTTELKYGHRDHRGGGRASGRETVSRVIAGYFASLIISQIQVDSYISALGEYHFSSFNPSSQLGLIDSTFDDEVENYLLNLKEKGESCGGKVRTIIKGCPVGLGEPVFDKLKAVLSHGMLSIGSCMGISFGLGEDFITKLGTEISNDSKNFSGIEGGISNGEDIYFDLVFKAPSTVGQKALEGRHDPCILPRVLPVVESMAFIVLADMYLRHKKLFS